MIVGVPNETNTNETRAAIIPPVAEELVDLRREYSVIFGRILRCSVKVLLLLGYWSLE